ncbi:hypothetical protein SSP24_78400 [Streptomyces spinoverrucosus]|uniref:Uncharacterized protein n=1 Tax=Streptomyces spinoverrucosus TaxID=284043 RepID=A0A4Y3VVP0_9ACTN|nr:hypothetical protein SSP24_78400 [Streptomyces spinoverrucosus]GHB76575.1 hypothetical protein GCM10010397_53910 [Streptomyces spinoverrucosus]
MRATASAAQNAVTVRTAASRAAAGLGCFTPCPCPGGTSGFRDPRHVRANRPFWAVLLGKWHASHFVPCCGSRAPSFADLDDYRIPMVVPRTELPGKKSNTKAAIPVTEEIPVKLVIAR